MSIDEIKLQWEEKHYFGKASWNRRGISYVRKRSQK